MYYEWEHYYILQASKKNTYKTFCIFNLHTNFLIM
jgi:hypothetical protein